MQRLMYACHTCHLPGKGSTYRHAAHTAWYATDLDCHILCSQKTCTVSRRADTGAHASTYASAPREHALARAYTSHVIQVAMLPPPPTRTRITVEDSDQTGPPCPYRHPR
eukprot:6148960-Pleurochrysis_carterae.AAC.2